MRVRHAKRIADADADRYPALYACSIGTIYRGLFKY